MKNSIKALVSIIALSAGNAGAESFNVTVDITNQLTDLTVTETQALKFPTINLDGSNNANGNRCYATDSSSPLCLGTEVGVDKNPPTFTISGTPNDAITVVYGNSEEANGMQVKMLTPRINRNLDANGQTTVSPVPYLELTDVDAVVADSQVYTYTVTATYQ